MLTNDKRGEGEALDNREHNLALREGPIKEHTWY